MQVNRNVCASVYKHGFSTWTVNSHSLMCISYTHAHTPYPVLTAVLWSRSRSDGVGEGEGDCGSSWGISLFSLSFFYWLVLASPKKSFKETPLWQFWTGQHSESYNYHSLKTQTYLSDCRFSYLSTLFYRTFSLLSVIWAQGSTTYWNLNFKKSDTSYFQDFLIWKHPWNSFFLPCV